MLAPMDAPDSAPNPSVPEYLELTTKPVAPGDDQTPPGITFAASGGDSLPVTVEKVVPVPLCGDASCVDRPFARCDWPAGHAPIEFVDPETGTVDFRLDHGDSLRGVFWDQNEDEFQFNGTPESDIPEPTTAVIDDLVAQIEAAGRKAEQ